MESVQKIFSRLAEIKTEHLLIRRMQIRDAEDMYEYASLPEVTRYLLWDPHPDLSYTKRYLAYVGTRYRAGDFFDLAVVEQASGKMIGTCGFARFDLKNACGEVGYVLNPAYQRRGYGREALPAILDLGFSGLGLYRIEARFMKDNLASRRLAEKCGMQFEGIAKGLMLIKGKHEDIGIAAAVRPLQP